MDGEKPQASAEPPASMEVLVEERNKQELSPASTEESKEIEVNGSTLDKKNKVQKLPSKIPEGSDLVDVSTVEKNEIRDEPEPTIDKVKPQKKMSRDETGDDKARKKKSRDKTDESKHGKKKSIEEEEKSKEDAKEVDLNDKLESSSAEPSEKLDEAKTDEVLVEEPRQAEQP
uniref:BLVR domain-containing protein n=1 Tax=Mesocestoides corti TaxID=53468 RepID=A0A5K3G881_MESCO